MQVVRCRFVEYDPSGIVALSYCVGNETLAVGRENGDVEIWDPRTWTLVQRLHGSHERPVRNIVWTTDPLTDEYILITSGLHGQITTWDVHRMVERRSITTFGGAAWDMALNPKGNVLAVACADGRLRLFEVENGVVEFQRALAQQEGQLLSVAWHPGGRYLVTGSSESTVVIWEAESGRSRSTFHVDTGPKAVSASVWSVFVLSDATIVIGDSLGQTQFWDGRTSTLKWSHKRHEADILAVCASEDESVVFSSGVDNTLNCFVRNTADTGTRIPWLLSATQRSHTHDVRALAIARGVVEPIVHKSATGPAAEKQLERRRAGIESRRARHGRGPPIPHTQAFELFPIVVSGGVDAKLCVHRLASPDDFTKLKSRSILPFTANMGVSMRSSSAPPTSSSQLLLFQHANRTELWRLPNTPVPSEKVKLRGRTSESTTASVPQSTPSQRGGTTSGSKCFVRPLDHTLLLRLSLKGTMNMVCSALSPNSRWVACANPDGTRLFQLSLSPQNRTTSEPVVLKRIALPKGIPAAQRLLFLPDSHRLAIAGCGSKGPTMYLLALTDDREDAPRPMPSNDTIRRASRTEVAVHLIWRFALDVDRMVDDDSTSGDSDSDGEARRSKRQKRTVVEPEQEGEEEDASDDSDSDSEDSGSRESNSEDDIDGDDDIDDSVADSVAMLAVSPDGQWLAAQLAFSGQILLCNLDTLQPHGVVPNFGVARSLSVRPTAMAFHPTAPVLVVAYSSNAFYLYNVEDCELVEWSKTYSDQLPSTLLGRQEKIIGITFNPSQASAVVLYSSSWFCVVDTEQPAVHAGDAAEDDAAASSGQVEQMPPIKSFQMVRRYQSLLHMDFVGPNLAMVVERPWSHVLEGLPEALYRHKYGT